MQNHPWRSTWQKQRNGELKPIALTSRYLIDAGKKFHRGISATARSLRAERFWFHLYRNQIQLYLDHQALELRLERNKPNKQCSARLTRWLDKLIFFDVSLKHTARKEINLIDFTGRIPPKTVTGRKTRRKISD